METLPDILQINDTLVYFVYGQVFFSLGLAIALHSRRRSRLDLATQLSWLAAFGFTHGLHEWAHVFLPLQAPYLLPTSIVLLNAARVALLALSFFFLGQFGALVALPAGRLRRIGRLVFAVLLLGSFAWAADLILTEGQDTPALLSAEVGIRRVMGFAAAALAALGMLRQARWVANSGLAGIARDFALAALSFGAYALLAGFVVPVPDRYVAQWPVFHPQVDLLGVPAPILRSLAGLGVVLGIVRGLRIFEIETDRRLEEAERARFQASEQARTAMETMAQTIAVRRDLSGLLDAALGQVVALSGAAAGWLMLARRDTGRLELQATSGWESPPLRGVPCESEDRCACQTVMASGKAGAFSDGSCRLCPESARKGWSAGVPLAAHSRSVGVLRLAGGDLSPERLALLESLGRQLGLAVENAELAREVARKEAARAQLLRKVIEAQEEERKRVARELHDQTGQSLIAVIMSLGAVGERMEGGPGKLTAMVDEARQVAVQALESTRALIMGLRPAALDDLGLVPALRRFAEELARKGNLEIAIEASGYPRRLPGDVEIVMFRVLQETLNNVVRHSRARRATVYLIGTDTEVRAEVVDDGIGFDLAEATSRPESGRGLGLLGMKERAALLGGKVRVKSAPGQGSRVLVRIPRGGERES